MVGLQQSGTTATLVTLVGWDVFVANVGDSCAYLDTGCEVLQASHTLCLLADFPKSHAVGCLELSLIRHPGFHAPPSPLHEDAA